MQGNLTNKISLGKFPIRLFYYLRVMRATSLPSANSTMPSQLSCDAPCSLLLKTRRLLRADLRTLPEIQRATRLPFYWLVDFKKGKSVGCSVNRVQFLFEYLSGRKLKL